MQTDIMAKLGAATVHLPGTDVYTALERGVIDGAKVFGRSANWGFGIHEVTHWITLTGMQPATCLEFVANKGAWDKLPADIKAILEAATREYSAESFASLHLADMEVTEKWLKLGNEIIQFPESEKAKLRQIAMPIWEKWAGKDALSKKAFDSQTAFMRQEGLLK
jgi:TRAP-type mannitol/chloroaromatic compound transport system substrate-binding protein